MGLTCALPGSASVHTYHYCSSQFMAAVQVCPSPCVDPIPCTEVTYYTYRCVFTPVPWRLCTITDTPVLEPVTVITSQCTQMAGGLCYCPNDGSGGTYTYNTLEYWCETT